MEQVYDLASRAGIGGGAVLLLVAFFLLARGQWYPRSTVDDLRARVQQLEDELARERERHRTEVQEWQARTFNALGVTERVTRLADETAAARAVRRRAHD